VKNLMRHDDSTSACRQDVLCRGCVYLCVNPRVAETTINSLCLDAGARHGTSQQQNTHIGELRDICYPWHPWSDHKVRVHATLVKRGQAVARCSLEDVQPFRIREVPLWMLDAAACCKIQSCKCKVANVESLRELKALLQPTQRINLEFANQTQHPCLLDA